MLNAEKARSTIQDVEDLQLRFGYGVKTLGAVFEAMAYGQSEHKDYVDAVYGVYDYLSSINSELSGVLETYYGSPCQPSEDGN